MNKRTMPLHSNHEYIVEAQDIRKHYPMGKSSDLHVLKGIDLRIRSGEIVAVMGPSGVGKSTLLHIIGALDRPTSGQVLLDNTDVFDMEDASLASFRNQKVGFVFQFHHLMPEFTALENVAMPGLIMRMPPKDAFQRAETLLKEVSLQDRAEHRPNQMSGGEQQRVAFARALMSDPLLILADEPSGNLDMANSKTLHDLMWGLVRDKGKTFVMVTHNRDLADRADRIIELFDGRVKI